MKNDSSSHRAVSQKFDEFQEIKPTPPAGKRAYSHGAESALLMVTSRPVAVVVGFGVSLLVLALAAYAFSAAVSWARVDRSGARVGYTIVGFFLTVAGVGGLLATYNHNFRLPKQGAPAHH
jgi:hypothetical protein